MSSATCDIIEKYNQFQYSLRGRVKIKVITIHVDLEPSPQLITNPNGSLYFSVVMTNYFVINLLFSEMV